MADFIYATLLIGNTNQISNMNDSIPAKGSFTSSSPILEKPDEYIGRIQRIAVSTLSVPLIIPLLELNQTDPNKLVYQFAMGYNGVYSDPINVIFQQQQSNQVVPVAPAGGFTSQDLTSKYYYIYYYSNFLQMWNHALITALANLVAKATLPTVPTTTPFFYYDPSCGIVLQAEANGFFGQDPNSTPTTNLIQIYCGSYILPLINGIPTTYISNPTGCNYCINLWNQTYLTVPPLYYTQKQQNIGELCYWPSINLIQVQSSMPVLYELNPAPIGTAGTGQLPSQVSNVLTDITIDNTVSPGSYHSTQIFNNIDSLRVFNITKKSPIYQIDAQIFWQDQFGRTFPLYIGTQESISIKYEFIKKDIYSK